MYTYILLINSNVVVITMKQLNYLLVLGELVIHFSIKEKQEVKHLAFNSINTPFWVTLYTPGLNYSDSARGSCVGTKLLFFHSNRTQA